MPPNVGPQFSQDLVRQKMGTQSRKSTPSGRETKHDTWPAVWFALGKYSWTSLVIVPAHESLSTLPIARAVVAAGKLFEQHPIVLVEAEGIAPSLVSEVITSFRDRAAAGERTVIAVGSPLIDYAAIPIARAADAAVLLVSLASTGRREANRTIEAIGRTHFLGSITAAAW